MCVLGMREELYRMVGTYKTNVRIVLPSLENRSEILDAEDLESPLLDLRSHLKTQLMKEIAILISSDAMKREKVKGVPPMENDRLGYSASSVV